MSISTRLTAALAMSAVMLPLAVRAADTPPTDAEKKLEQQIDQMQQQLLEMKSQLQGLKKQNDALAEQQQQQAQQVQQVAAAAQPQSGISPNLSLWGYGEIYYTHPTHETTRTTTDLARAVFGIGYRFDDRTVFNSEFEVEHAVSSSDDAGEFEVEQFYVDHQLTDWASVKAGLFLMPFGLLNEHHEPTQFYGVQRNFVESLIIPTTWREGGIGFHGNTTLGLTWDAGVTTGLNLSEWEVNPEDPLYRSALELANNGAGPMQQGHQELQLAKSQNLSQYLSLNYNGLPGLLAGAAVFTGKADTQAGLPSERTTLWETHARWTPGAADFSAVYARGTFSNTGAFNALNPGASNPMPASFLGYYLQGAYTVWQNDTYRFSPFVRWEHYDMGASYAGIAPGFTAVPQGLASDGLPWPQPRDQVWTFGGNFYVTPHVVLKADYQSFHNNKLFSRFDFGLGLAY
jgi:Phosphate-selective porin O and P